MITALRALLGLVPWQAWALAGVLGATGVWHWRATNAAHEAGRRFEREAAKIEAGKRIIEMEKANESFRALPALERCRAFMRDSGLPDDHCK
jgi:hypothetical protein